MGENFPLIVVLLIVLIDFDLYLKRPGSRGDICLNPSRDITEYGIKKDVSLIHL